MPDPSPSPSSSPWRFVELVALRFAADALFAIASFLAFRAFGYDGIGGAYVRSPEDLLPVALFMGLADSLRPLHRPSVTAGLVFGFFQALLAWEADDPRMGLFLICAGRIAGTVLTRAFFAAPPPESAR